MSLPTNFAKGPTEEPHRFFRNLCIEFRNTIKSSKDSSKLEWEMERFLDASKQMNWHHKNTGVYHKDEGEKAALKVWSEFNRYVADIKGNKSTANPQDLLDALNEVERLVNNLKAT